MFSYLKQSLIATAIICFSSISCTRFVKCDGSLKESLNGICSVKNQLTDTTKAINPKAAGKRKPKPIIPKTVPPGIQEEVGAEVDTATTPESYSNLLDENAKKAAEALKCLKAGNCPDKNQALEDVTKSKAVIDTLCATLASDLDPALAQVGATACQKSDSATTLTKDTYNTVLPKTNECIAYIDAITQKNLIAEQYNAPGTTAEAQLSLLNRYRNIVLPEPAPTCEDAPTIVALKPIVDPTTQPPTCESGKVWDGVSCVAQTNTQAPTCTPPGVLAQTDKGLLCTTGEPPKCGEGFVLDPAIQMCVPSTEPPPPPMSCPAGQEEIINTNGSTTCAVIEVPKTECVSPKVGIYDKVGGDLIGCTVNPPPPPPPCPFPSRLIGNQCFTVEVCKVGDFFDKATKTCKPLCEEGETWSALEQKCLPPPPPPVCTIGDPRPECQPPCPAGQELVMDKCVAQCPSGSLRNLSTGQCNPDWCTPPTVAKDGYCQLPCPTGQAYDGKTNKCLPIPAPTNPTTGACNVFVDDNICKPLDKGGYFGGEIFKPNTSQPECTRDGQSFMCITKNTDFYGNASSKVPTQEGKLLGLYQQEATLSVNFAWNLNPKATLYGCNPETSEYKYKPNKVDRYTAGELLALPGQAKDYCVKKCGPNEILDPETNQCVTTTSSICATYDGTPIGGASLIEVTNLDGSTPVLKGNKPKKVSCLNHNLAPSAPVASGYGNILNIATEEQVLNANGTWVWGPTKRNVELGNTCFFPQESLASSPFSPNFAELDTWAQNPSWGPKRLINSTDVNGSAVTSKTPLKNIEPQSSAFALGGPTFSCQAVNTKWAICDGKAQSCTEGDGNFKTTASTEIRNKIGVGVGGTGDSYTGLISVSYTSHTNYNVSLGAGVVTLGSRGAFNWTKLFGDRGGAFDLAAQNNYTTGNATNGTTEKKLENLPSLVGVGSGFEILDSNNYKPANVTLRLGTSLFSYTNYTADLTDGVATGVFDGNGRPTQINYTFKNTVPSVAGDRNLFGTYSGGTTFNGGEVVTSRLEMVNGVAEKPSFIGANATGWGYAASFVTQNAFYVSGGSPAPVAFVCPDGGAPDSTFDGSPMYEDSRVASCRGFVFRKSDKALIGWTSNADSNLYGSIFGGVGTQGALVDTMPYFYFVGDELYNYYGGFMVVPASTSLQLNSNPEYAMEYQRVRDAFYRQYVSGSGWDPPIVSDVTTMVDYTTTARNNSFGSVLCTAGWYPCSSNTYGLMDANPLLYPAPNP